MKTKREPFKVGDSVRLPGEDVRGIVTRATREQAYVEWIGFTYPPGSDGWYYHHQLLPHRAGN